MGAMNWKGAGSLILLKKNAYKQFRYISFVIAVLMIALLPDIAYGEEFTVLGNPPDETAVEKSCTSLIIEDYNTGSLLKCKNENQSMILTGGVVRLMAALTALDYLQPEDVVNIECAPVSLPEGARNIGFQNGISVTVNDLIAAMLVYCANDAAVVLGNAVEEAAGSNNFVALMNHKADELGMADTVYINATGLTDEGQITTSADQLILARAAFSNETISSIMSRYEYDTQITDTGFPETMTQFSTIMVPGDASYNDKVTAVARGSSGSETNILVRAQDGDCDIIIFMTYPSRHVEKVYTAVSDLIEEYGNLPAFDFSEYVISRIADLTTGMDTVELPWEMNEGQSLTFVAYKGFEPDYAQIGVEPDADSLTNLEDGTAVLTAEVYYQDTFLTTISLTAPDIADVQQTLEPDSSTSPDSSPNSFFQMYEPANDQTCYSFMERCGWLVYTAAAGLLAAVLILVGKMLKGRMK